MASGSKTKTEETFLVCSCCSNHVQIRRKRNKLKEYDHIKHMYCYKCLEITAHIEKGEEIFYPQWIKDLMAKEQAEEEQEIARRKIINESRRPSVSEPCEKDIAVWYC